MTAGAQAGAGPAWRSTRGGRSVQRAATAVQGASLRTLPLVRAAALGALTDPLAPLLAGPPDLALLGATADRAAAPGRTPDAPRRAPARRAAPTASTRPDAPSWPGPTGASGAAGAPAAGSGPTRSIAAPDVASTSPHDSSLHPGTPRRAADPSVPRTVVAGTSRLPGATVGVGRPGTGPVPTPAGTLERISAAALAAVARSDAPGTDAGAPVTAATQHDPTHVDEAAGRAAGSSAWSPTEAAARHDAPSGWPDVSATTGALGELLGRWQDPGPAPAPAPDVAAGPGRRIPFAPLTAAADGSREATTTSDHEPDDVPLDRVQEALDELLRREAERHGLDGGLV